MRAWRKFLGVSHSYKARYDGGRYDLQEPTDVAKAIQEDQAMVANLLELAKGEVATLPTLPPVASGNGLQDSSMDPERTQHGSIEEDNRILEKEVKRLRRAEANHRGNPHLPSECPKCQAAIDERADDHGSDSISDNSPKQVEGQDEPSWASFQNLVQWLEANTAVTGGMPPPQFDREQQPATTLDHDRLIDEQREQLKQQAALEEPSVRRRWNGHRPPQEEVQRLRKEKKLRKRAARHLREADANQAYKRRKGAMQEKRHQDMNARRYQAELAKQKRRRD